MITDAIRAAGMGDGEYALGSVNVHVHDGRATLADGTLGGSTLTMDVALRNVMAATGCSLIEASEMCSATPARAIGLENDLGKLEPGYLASIVVLHQDTREVLLTMINGAVVYQKSEGLKP
jgi:N-acetylglucosamine-6-phosphate deacetylase